MKTKIYGTIGPSCCDENVLNSLFSEGMTGIRINLSHSDLKDVDEWLNIIKKVSRNSSDILIDLRGPELRIGGNLRRMELEEGSIKRIAVSKDGEDIEDGEIPIQQIVFENLSVGQEIMIDDGKILMVVDKVNRTYADCRVIRGGVLEKEKSIALPGVYINPPTLTKSDIGNISQINKYGITGVMLPFVRGRQDMINLKKALDAAGAEEVRMFAKIENLAGVNALPEILDYCDEVVVARGDLGNAMPLWELPVIQDRISSLCRCRKKDFMIVTQMLSSMENSKVPTRAEVSDIYNAVKYGASSVMLTGETAIGKYPVEAMRYMVNTVKSAEEYLNNDNDK